MTTECKYCGEEVSAMKLMAIRLIRGELPPCPNCGADDNTLDVRVQNESGEEVDVRLLGDE